MKGQKNRRKLRNYLIRKEVQLKIIATNLLHIFLVALMTCFVVLAPIIRFMEPSFSLDMRYQAAQIFIVIAERLPIVFGIVLILIVAHQLLITHQVCGPLVNFIHTFKKVSQGDLTRKVFLRPHDLLKEEGEHINQMLDGLTHHIGAVKQGQRELVRLLAELADLSVKPSERQRFEEALNAAQKQAERLNDHLAVFVLPTDQQKECRA